MGTKKGSPNGPAAGSSPVAGPDDGRPSWSLALRALREARGITQEGWSARLGYGQGTIKRWEYGRTVPGADAEAALVRICGELGLFRTFDRGPLAGVAVTHDFLRDLLAEARLGGGRTTPRPVAQAPASSPTPARALPVPLTRLIGREREIDEGARLLCVSRLVTITGPGGVGKTRLALAVTERVAADFAEGAVFIDLTPIADAELVPSAIAQAIGLHESGGRPLSDSVARFLRDRHALLVLDNAEHVLPAAPFLAELLATCPHITLLVTSRVRLRLRGERHLVLRPLPVPDGDPPAGNDASHASPAVTLFRECAAEAAPDLVFAPEDAPVVAEICRRLDGLPLAIELAAARLALLTPRALLARLVGATPASPSPGSPAPTSPSPLSPLALLTGGGRDLPERQRTLADTVRWSYDLLDPRARALFRRLAVFSGGFTLAAAEAVSGADGDRDTATLGELTALLDASLVHRRDTGGEPRFGMLETVRAFAAERLTVEGPSDARERHAIWAEALAEEGNAGIRVGDAGAWQTRLDDELGNLRAALAWALEHDPAGLCVSLVQALHVYWQRRGHIREGSRWAEALLARPALAAPNVARSQILFTAGSLTAITGDLSGARARLEESLAIGRARRDPARVAEALLYLGWFLRAIDQDAARRWLDESVALFKELDDRRQYAQALTFLGTLASGQGDEARARTLLDLGVTLLRPMGAPVALGHALLLLGACLLRFGDVPAARAAFEESLEHQRRAGDIVNAQAAMAALALALVREGDAARAAPLVREALSVSGRLGMLWEAQGHLDVAARILHRRGESLDAVRLAGAAAGLRAAHKLPIQRGAEGEYRAAYTAMREAIGADAFAAAWAEGDAMTFDGAVARAQALLAASD